MVLPPATNFIHISKNFCSLTTNDIDPDKQYVHQGEVDCGLNEDCCFCIGTGSGDNGHMFMAAEGYCCCTSCKQKCCMYCIFQKNIGEKYYCSHCLLPEISVSIEYNDEELTLTKKDMIARLHDFGVELTQTETLSKDDLLEMYDAVRYSRSFDKHILDKIRIPKMPASYLHQLQQDAKILSFDLNDGCRFIVDRRLNNETIIQIVKILASLVTMYRNDEEKQNNKKNTTLTKMCRLPSSALQKPLGFMKDFA
jgi:hypothetical protein